MLHIRKSFLCKQLTALFAIISFIAALAPARAARVHGGSDLTAGPITSLPTQPQFIDGGFQPQITSGSGTVNRALIQPDGKILVAGNFHLVNGAFHGYIVRFNTDGSLDTTFNTTGGQSNQIMAMGLQSDGKIIIGGNFTNVAGQTVGDIARLNSDGTFDVTFNSSGVYYTAGANSSIADLSISPNDSIYIAGSFTSYNGTATNRIARLNPNGDLDTTFIVGTGANSTVSAVSQVSGGKVLIGGIFTSYNGTTMNRLARLNSDGTLDTTFTIGTGPNSNVKTIALQSDGKIIIGGQFATYNAVAKNGLARLNADGTDDATFTVTGTAAQANSIALQADGKLIVGGNFTAIAGTTVRSIARLNSDGTFDNTFNAGTGLSQSGTFSPVANAVAVQSDGKVVICGSFMAYNGTARSSIARANPDGSLDNTLNPAQASAGNIWSMSKTPDGKVVIGGQFAGVNGFDRSNVARLNADGSTDTTFDPGSGADGLVTGVGVQPDGKVILGGEFTHYNGTAITGIARLNTDGSLDTSFNVGAGQDGDVYTAAFQGDGKILIGGVFTHYAGIAINNLARLNSDGSLDATFGIGTGPNNTVRKIIIQPDNKILVGGEYATFNATAKTRLTRLNTDGSFDSAFVTGTISSNVKDMLLESTGKLVIVGSFTTINGTTRNRAARLNSDGSLDTMFDPGVGFTQDVLTIAPTPEGKYIVGGSFTTASGLSRNRLARLRNDGSIDAKFLQGLGPVAQSGVAIRQIFPFNNKYLIAGQFEMFNTSPRTSLVLMSNATKAPVDYDGDGKTDYAIARQYGGLGRWTYWIETSAKQQIASFDFGIFTVDALQPGDFDGDGMTDVAVWTASGITDRPNGYWIIFSSTGQVKFVPFGIGGDIPVMDDYDGDGKDDMAVVRVPNDTQGPGQATWIYQGSFNNPKGNQTYVPFGMRYGTQADQVDKFIFGDFDGDGKADFRVKRRLDMTNASSNIPAVDYTLTSKGILSLDYFGWNSDRSNAGDYDGDGKTDLALARGFNITPNNTTWFIRYTGGAPDAQFNWGAGGLDNFVQGDYDGDGITDPAVYRRGGENNYYILRSSDQTMMVVHWGMDDEVGGGGPASDVPIAIYNSR